MRRSIITISFGIFLSVLSLSESFDIKSKIVFGSVLFRHGERVPLITYPNDPHKNESEWPVAFGQLTKRGMRQHLALGRWLRSRYNHILPEMYSVNDIYVRSSDVDRTLMSAQSNLAGLYPPKGDQVWELDWIPIPVHTKPENEDNLIAGKKPCAKYKKELEKAYNSSYFFETHTNNSMLYEYLANQTGKEFKTLEDVKDLYDVLWIQSQFNKTLPSWTSSVFPDKMFPSMLLSYDLWAHNQILKRLRMGLLIGEMVQHMVLKSQNALEPNRKLWIYSGHEVTIINLLKALGVYKPHVPPYAAMVLVELRQNSKKQFFVTVSYKNTDNEPTVLKIPGCSYECLLQDFVKLTRDLIPQDWNKECQLDSTSKSAELFS